MIHLICAQEVDPDNPVNFKTPSTEVTLTVTFLEGMKNSAMLKFSNSFTEAQKKE